ncbi:hypothetical protein [Paraburkholderia flava]|uniref:hypothetical protein n=1 Tax=Paraburkholderia flava TaxID=2547393 RepID=UPI001061026A|nr:hypothetical protein [Paraburkholderia flava]
MYTITNCRAMKPLAFALLLMLAACSQHASQTESSVASAVPASGAPPDAPAAASVANSEERDKADENGTPGVASSSAQSSDGIHRGPRIKGMQLGDSLEEVRRQVEGLIPNTRCELRTVSATIHPLYCDGVVLAGLEFESGRLSSLSMTSLLVQSVFGVMPLKEFVQNFASAYDIPRMEPQTGANGVEYLSYRNESGWEVDIFADATFLLKAIPTAAQQTGKFN